MQSGGDQAVRSQYAKESKKGLSQMKKSVLLSQPIASYRPSAYAGPIALNNRSTSPTTPLLDPSLPAKDSCSSPYDAVATCARYSKPLGFFYRWFWRPTRVSK
ncbi:hypothetical protein PCASD_01477 [Puccinia coronata f. sp. avenae]|uniref:Uncharacterized protein n=1 Tax=Puccinia coronata f. sp. avenae TaxID=200324 RepID=A0A2N5RWH0_9BASI|nr:hypothetical protein PCASD_26323 [Puccinia coronata f. sp. avenae]PLW05321.1 hypothetical protein PCASD_26321 [Puccinia coronata f. sp. avenae]PLW50432.1 hypothetical protein PCASD_01475 [Puccinia coronata f. sp. avenae]PLW50434.1 hypothetical protein PCASD_01477 [Puccinia coronata f. sp. avenae]